MEKITIHRALSELKLIASKIEKTIESITPSGIVQKDKKVNGVYEKEEFIESAKSKYQSVLDLIDRRNKIKSAIVAANGVTKIKVAEREMTIADAINLKATIDLRKSFIEILKRKHRTSLSALEQNNAKVDANSLELAKVALAKQNVKLSDDDVKKVIEPYLENNKFSLVDPLEVEKKIELLEKEVSDFESEVDAVLSEINATTFIEI